VARILLFLLPATQYNSTRMTQPTQVRPAGGSGHRDVRRLVPIAQDAVLPPFAGIDGTARFDRGKDYPYTLRIPSVRTRLIVSKLTSKAQTTIPQSVRSALGVTTGDEIAYAIEDGRVVLTKAPARGTTQGDPWETPFSTFWEWSSPEDQEDFAGL
jgi:antitoxin PrlF